MQLKDILRERAALSLVTNAISPDMIGLIAAHASKRGGDCRVAIETLRKAARNAERGNASEISEENVRMAFEDPETHAVQKSIPYLSESHKQVLKGLFLLGGKNVSSNDLYVKLASQGIGLSDRRIRELLVELEKRKAITTTTDVSGRGRTKRITVNFSEQTMEN
jgi:Cdc6-like AAA superfamily ATPase